jgi:hypothetical protein
MLTLDRVVRPGTVGRPSIELPYAGLNRLGFGLTPGKLSMLAAGPGTGKSALAMSIALDLGLRTLYESPDQDSWTTAIRTLAHNTGHPQSYIRACLEPGVPRPDEIDVALLDAEHVQFSFDSYTTEEIHADVMAYGVIHGSYPELMVVDNLLNVARGDDTDYAAMGRALDELDALAQRTGAHVMVLHHATGQYDDGDKPIPLSGLVNKVSKLPVQILTMHRDGENHRVLCVVKNRTGRQDPSGRLGVPLRFDGERITFMDQE